MGLGAQGFRVFGLFKGSTGVFKRLKGASGMRVRVHFDEFGLKGLGSWMTELRFRFRCFGFRWGSGSRV